MVTLHIRGHEIESIHIKDAYDRRAVQILNSIIKLLGTIGVSEDYIDVPIEGGAFKKATASVSWYFENQNLYYSYGLAGKFVENLAIVHKILELEIASLVEGTKSTEDFVLEFKEEEDIKEQRLEARKTLGLDDNIVDMEVIDKTFKNLAKEHHPDTKNGNEIRFKEINNAHKILRRELQ